MRAEREYTASVPIVDSLEGNIVPATEPGHQVLVAFARDSPAIEPTSEPDNCCAHPHAHSVRYIRLEVQSSAFGHVARGGMRRAGRPASPAGRRPGGC